MPEEWRRPARPWKCSAPACGSAPVPSLALASKCCFRSWIQHLTPFFLLPSPGPPAPSVPLWRTRSSLLCVPSVRPHQTLITGMATFTCLSLLDHELEDSTWGRCLVHSWLPIRASWGVSCQIMKGISAMLKYCKESGHSKISLNYRNTSYLATV